MTVGNDFRLVPDDADASSYYKKTDVNDKVCAIIKVTPDNPLSGRLILETLGGLRPELPPGNESNFREKDHGEWWFWVSPQISNITFTCHGYTPTDTIGVALKPGRVYRVSLHVESSVSYVQNSKPRPFTGIKMRINPSGARVLYGTDNSYSIGSFEVYDGIFEQYLPQGHYYFKIEKDYYTTWTKEIDITNGKAEITVELKPNFGQIVVDSNPSGSDVFIDGKLIGPTPIKSPIKLSGGKHELRVQKQDYYAKILSITVEPNGKEQYIPTITLVEQFGRATLTCDDTEATLVITDPSGKEVARGKSGMKVNLNSRYDYTFKAIRDGHAPQSQLIMGQPLEGKDLTYHIGNPAPMYGTLLLSSNPTDARVFIDDKPFKSTPFTENIIVGRHVIKIEKEGYREQIIDVIIDHQRDKTLTIDLKPNLPDNKKVLQSYNSQVQTKEKEVCQWVDLGLPSGIKWAKCNLGASRPEEFGDYYAWGEAEPYYVKTRWDAWHVKWKEGKQEGYNWSSYRWCRGTRKNLTKYNNDTSFGVVDNKTVLDPDDDVAHIKLGEKWRIPTDEEWKELVDNCSFTWASIDGVYGIKVVGPNGSSIFLPAAGYRQDLKLFCDDRFPMSTNNTGHYWTSSLYLEFPYKATCYFLYNGRLIKKKSHAVRCIGASIRPVSE